MNMASSEFGHEVGLMHELIITGRKVGADREFWAMLAHDAQLLERVIELVYAPTCYDVIVDYSYSLSEVIQAGGYQVKSVAVDSFPAGGYSKRNVSVALFRLRRDMTSDECVAEMEKHGYRPAVLEELLALYECHPVQTRSVGLTIVALGPAEQRGKKYYPVATTTGSQGTRFLLNYNDFVEQFTHERWPVEHGFRFAAVRKDA